MNKLRDKQIVIVGGSSGIGFGAAEAFLSCGAKVTIISSSEANVKAALTRLQNSSNSPTSHPSGSNLPQKSQATSTIVPTQSAGQTPSNQSNPQPPNAQPTNPITTGRLRGFVGDVRNEGQFVDLLRKLSTEVGGIDHIIFSSVDKIIRGKLEELALDDAKWLFGVKFWGSVVIGKACLKYDIIKQGGSLTLTSGMAAIKPGKASAVGAALNGGVLSLTKGLASDLSDKGIRCNCIIPGLVKTELWGKLGRTMEEQGRMERDMMRRLPVGFVAGPADIAEGYVFAVRADYMTGSLIEIDGGMTL